MNYRAMRKLIETIKQHSDKLNDLLTCENIDSEQVAEEAKAAYCDIVDLRKTLKSLSFIAVRNNKHDVVHAHNVINLICTKMFPVLKQYFKHLDGNASTFCSFYAIALDGLRNISKDKLKQLSAIRSEQQKPYGKKYG